MTTKIEADMRINNPVISRKLFLILEIAYWTLSLFCFMIWLHLGFIWIWLSDSRGYHEASQKVFSFITYVFMGKDPSAIFIYAPLFLPFIFITISIVRRKISAYELVALVIIWCLVIYVVPHLRG